MKSKITKTEPKKQRGWISIQLSDYRDLVKKAKQKSWVEFWALFGGCVMGWVIASLVFIGYLAIQNAWVKI